MHSLIINSLHHEPLFTAEQVINEIEGMMEEVDVMLFQKHMFDCYRRQLPRCLSVQRGHEYA